MNTRAATRLRGTREQRNSYCARGRRSGRSAQRRPADRSAPTLLQDDAKDESSYMTWGERPSRRKWRQPCERVFSSQKNGPTTLRRVGLIRSWDACIFPLIQPALENRRASSPAPGRDILPAIYGCHGLVDIQTVDLVLRSRMRLANCFEAQLTISAGTVVTANRLFDGRKSVTTLRRHRRRPHRIDLDTRSQRPRRPMRSTNFNSSPIRLPTNQREFLLPTRQLCRLQANADRRPAITFLPRLSPQSA